MNKKDGFSENPFAPCHIEAVPSPFTAYERRSQPHAERFFAASGKNEPSSDEAGEQ